MTEIRGLYYSALGRLEDVLEMAGAWVDSIKYAGGSFAVMPAARVREINELAHRYDVRVSTGGFIERVLLQGYPARLNSRPST
jgi:phosphosulfolactate synthase (CoM biosynthesis protein A)